VVQKRLFAMRVFVLLFNAGTENEGIHTIRFGDRNTVLMFEQEDDATRYAMLLEAQDFPVPSVETVEREEVEEFCESAGYDCQFVPEGFVPENDMERLLIAPPEKNLEETDWQIQPKEEADEDLSNAELDQIRRRLEGLL
jgi:hypothetical protein